MNFILTNIQWDTDGQVIDLPIQLEVEAPSEQEAIDVASDKFGFCIHGAEVEQK